MAEPVFRRMGEIDDDGRIKQRLDYFVLEKRPTPDWGKAIKEVKPVGGRRKVAALSKFADTCEQPLSRWVVVGDSITDFRMLQAVEGAGGLAIAFNASEYALPYATMSLASTSISDLVEVFEAWQKDGRKGAEKIVKGKEKIGGTVERGYFHWLYGSKDTGEVMNIHKRIRHLVRKEAGKLG